jgi:hypothetical protein
LPQQQQYAQILTPSGQLQTVQIASLAPMGTTLLSPGQSQTSSPGSTNTTNSGNATGTVTITTSNDGAIQINTVENSGSSNTTSSSSNQSAQQQQQNQQQQQQSQQQQQLQSVPQQLTISGMSSARTNMN